LARGNCLLIGARGFLGNQIARLLRENDIDVIGTTRELAKGDSSSWIQYDFRHDSIDDRLGVHRYDFIIVAAKIAYANLEVKPTPGTEALPFDELFNQLSRFTRSGVTYLSSDAVFSGARGGYVETDAPDASEAYGSMQAIAERSLSVHVPNYLIVRPSFLFDVWDFHSDRRLSQLHKALTARTTFFGDTNVYKSPVPVVEAARVVVKRTLERQSGIAHVPGKRQSVYEFFEENIEPLGLSAFRQYLIARKNEKPSDTSLRSMFEKVSA
jgi:dTDP-4-dehydrorhamnose reductase